jgi:acetylornithine deacetylase/succinyl-diaminopimelate desuccinylase-like protein
MPGTWPPSSEPALQLISLANLWLLAPDSCILYLMSRDDALNDLIEFLRFPSVSADSQFKPHVESCANWLRQRFEKSGLEAEKLPTGGNPVVLARNKHKADRKTVLIYGHYDVQPPDPLELWQTPPFEPVIRDGRLIARGSTDNKGQIFAHVIGVEKRLQSKGDLPVNVIFLVEGEEETGSPHLEDFLRKHQAALAADIVVISDTGMVAPRVPTFTYGLRGILCLEVRLTGPAVDLHSGIFGGSVANPATVLVELLAKLHDEHGKVAVPGFYDRVKPIESWERERWATLPFNDQAWLKTTGAPALYGEEGFSTLERVWGRPTAEINGLGSGYQGEGPKTIVPSRATAKLSFRLVPDQDPTELRGIITKFLTQNCPPAVTIDVLFQHQGKPYLMEPESPFGQAAQRALEKTFGQPVAFIREGGSIPITQSFKDVLNLDTLLLGLALPDAKAHSPNENFPIENFEAGIRLNQELLAEIAELK